MTVTIRVKRRQTGAAGAPGTLKSGELAVNEVEDVVYYGEGDDGGGNAQSVIEIAGAGAFITLSTGQTISGLKTFSTAPRSSVDATAATDLVRKAQHDLKADENSPSFSGTPTAPTASTGVNNTQVATTAFVHAVVNGLVSGAPGALDTLNELAAALGDDPNFAGTITTQLADKAPLNSPSFTGNPTVPTQATTNNSTRAASTAFVHAVVADIDGGTF